MKDLLSVRWIKFNEANLKNGKSVLGIISSKHEKHNPEEQKAEVCYTYYYNKDNNSGTY